MIAQESAWTCNGGAALKSVAALPWKEIMTVMSPALSPEHLLRLLMIRNWIVMGDEEEARREFKSLPPDVRAHPEAEIVRQRLFARSEENKSDNK